MENHKVIHNNKSNNLGNKQFERHIQSYNEIHKNNVSYIERPEYSSKNVKNLNVDFSRYMVSGKASLGYNNIFQQNINNLPQNSNNVSTSNSDDKFSRFTINNGDLPPNIYHNFSTSTRLKRKNINYDINMRNTYSE